MGVSGQFEDESSGMVFPEAYVSLYKANTNIYKLADDDIHVQYANDSSLKPQDWDHAGGCYNCGYWSVSGQANVYANQAARQNNKKAITVVNVNIFVNDPSTVATAMYEKLKETFPTLEDC